MNPLAWQREHQVALLVGAVLGIAAGLLAGFAHNDIHLQHCSSGLWKGTAFDGHFWSLFRSRRSLCTTAFAHIDCGAAVQLRLYVHLIADPSIAGSEGTDQMISTEINEQGHHLAMAASLRVLARHVALAVNPSHPDEWFTELGQDVFDYVDRTTHSTNHPSETRAIKE